MRVELKGIPIIEIPCVVFPVKQQKYLVIMNCYVTCCSGIGEILLFTPDIELLGARSIFLFYGFLFVAFLLHV